MSCRIRVAFFTPVLLFLLYFTDIFVFIVVFDSQNKLRVQGENIYVRHSNLMLEVRIKTRKKKRKRKSE